MSLNLRVACDTLVEMVNGQPWAVGMPYDRALAAQHLYMARSKILARLASNGAPDRNWGGGSVEDIGDESYGYREYTVSNTTELGYHIQLVIGHADIGGAGIFVVPTGNSDKNPYRRVQYGFQWSSGYILGNEGWISWWIRPTDLVQFISDPGKTVGIVSVEEPEPANMDDDTVLAMPSSAHYDVMQLALRLANPNKGQDHQNDNRSTQ